MKGGGGIRCLLCERGQGTASQSAFILGIRDFKNHQRDLEYPDYIVDQVLPVRQMVRVANTRAEKERWYCSDCFLRHFLGR